MERIIPIAVRIRRLLRKEPVPPTTTAKVYNAKGKHVANLVMNGKTGTRRRIRVIKRRRRA